MKQTHLLLTLALAAILVHALPATKTSNLEAHQGPQPALPYPSGFNADTCPPNGNLFTYDIFQTVNNSESGSKRSFDARDPGLVPSKMKLRGPSPRQKETDACTQIALLNFSDLLGICFLRQHYLFPPFANQIINYVATRTRKL